jgi:hypothetical protein
MDVTFQGDLGRPGGALSGRIRTSPSALCGGRGTPSRLQTHPRAGSTRIQVPPTNLTFAYRPAPQAPPTKPAQLACAWSHLGMVMALCRKFSNFFWNEASCASSGGRTCPGGECWQGQQPGSVSASGTPSSRWKRGSWLLVGSRKPGRK